MNNGLSKSLGIVLLAAAVFAAAGCTPLGSPNSSTTPRGSSSAPASTLASPNSEPVGPSPEASAAGAAGTPGAVEAPAPSGAAQAEAPHAAPDPTFAPAEQKYLASRVPEGTDPNAILQVGQEQCAQLETVKAADQKAAISQLVERRDADVVEAIAGLCPALQPELDAAARGFTDGEFAIGAADAKEGGGSISAGRYEAWNPSETCLLLAYDAAGGTIAESNGTAVTIPAGAARVVSDGCYTWLAS